jgi:chromosome segregation ATPase
MTPTLNERVTVLEHRMDEQERLRASQDHDLSNLSADLRAQKTLLKAINLTQSEHTSSLSTLNQRVSELGRDMSAVKGDVLFLKAHALVLDEHVDELKGDVDELKGGLAEINGKIDMLIERGERS